MTYEIAKRRLVQAKAARDAHAVECPHWDYEGSDCLECADHDNAVRKARANMNHLQPDYV